MGRGSGLGTGSLQEETRGGTGRGILLLIRSPILVLFFHGLMTADPVSAALPKTNAGRFTIPQYLPLLPSTRTNPSGVGPFGFAVSCGHKPDLVEDSRTFPFPYL